MEKDVKEVSNCMSPEPGQVASMFHVRRFRSWLTLAASASEAAGTFRGAPKFLNSNQAGPSKFALVTKLWPSEYAELSVGHMI